MQNLLREMLPIGYLAQQQNKPYHDPIPFGPTYFWVWNFVH
ncbi:hypothetical protein HPS12939_1657 [Glaesserella parasuis 12939]|nr:hypothetical protein HPS12939_1657 [Glaesserella parasuis 12939]